MANRISHVIREVIETPDRNARVSQVMRETIQDPQPNVRVTSVMREVIIPFEPSAWRDAEQIQEFVIS